MSVPFVGEGHRKLVDEVVAEFGRVCAEHVPSWWSLEANTGWGKTRIIQEFYARLAVAQPEPPYWPPSILAETGDVVTVQRKRVHPPLSTMSADATPSWFWWGISCSSRHGRYLNALVHDLERFDERRDAIERRYRALSSRKSRAKRTVQRHKGAVGEAAIGDALSLVASAANVAVPGVGLLVLLGKWGIGHARTEVQHRSADGPGASNADLVAEVATELERLASGGIPLLIVIEDLHAADDVLIELVAKVLAAKSAPLFVLTTSWRGMIDQPHRAAHELLNRVQADRVRRVLCEDEVSGLSRKDLGAIVDAVLPSIDTGSRARLVDRYPNPYALQLACRTGGVRRSATRGSIPADVVDRLPPDVNALFRQLWEELPDELRRALMIASQLAPASVSDRIGFGDVRWDPELVSMAVQRVEWLAEELPQMAGLMRDAREAYAWVRTVDEWLQQFHDPVQREIAASDLSVEYGAEGGRELRAAVGDAAAELTAGEERGLGERATNRDRLLVALASEGLIAWSRPAFLAADGICRQALALRGGAELKTAIEVCELALTGSELEVEETFTLQNAHAACLAWVGRVPVAIERFETLLAQQMQVLGAEHPATLRTRNNLAGWLGEAGRFVDAAEQFAQLVDEQTRVCGADAPETLIARSNLARYIGEGGQVRQAIEQYELLVPDFTRILGPDSTDTLTARAGLAHFVGEDGRVDQALNLYRALLADQIGILGDDAPDTMQTRDSLAGLLRDAGLVSDAIEEYRALLDDERRVMGPDAPATMRTRGSLADAVGDAGAVAEAITQLRRLLEDQARVLGRDAPGTLLTRARVAGWTAKAGRIDDALEQTRELLEDELRVYGADAPPTLVTRSNYAFYLAQAGRLQEASTELEKVLDAQLRVLGSDHPDVLQNRTNLAEWLVNRGHLREALVEFDRLVDDYTRVLGVSAPGTLFVRSNLASCVAMSGQVKVAIEQFERLLEDHHRVLGQHERAAFLPHANLAHWLIRDERLDEGVAQYELLLEAQERLLDRDAPDTLRTRDNFARDLIEAKQLNAALQQLSQLSDAQIRALGPDALGTLITRFKLAGCLAQLGQQQEAIQQYQALLSDTTRVLGADDTLTCAVRTALGDAIAGQQ